MMYYIYTSKRYYIVLSCLPTLHILLCSNTSTHVFYLQLSFHVSYHTDRYISEPFVGRAIRANHPQYNDDDVLGDIGLEIVQAVYVVPFVLVFVVLIIIIVVYVGGGHLLHQIGQIKEKLSKILKINIHNPEDEHPLDDQLKQKLDKTLKKYKKALCNNLHMQANLTAVSLICCIFTIYTFTLDSASIVVENTNNLPKYFERMSYGLYIITIVFTVTSFLFDIIGIVWFLVVICYNCFYKEKWEVYIPVIFCIGSALLSLSFHFQNILIAWAIDPFYASRISLLYGIIIFSYFISFKYAFIAPIKITRRNDNCKYWSTKELILVAFSISIVTVVSTTITLIVSLFVAHVQTNGSLEQSITGIATMYNGAVILIGGLIAYSMGMQYFGNGFSLKRALKKAMKDMKDAPFNPDDNGTWQDLTEEGRITEVIKELIHRQACLAREEQTGAGTGNL